jgi:DNA-directed RNA polymerase subunit RPC12/RpoP
MEEKRMTERGFYEMEYRCANCGHIFKKQLPKGKQAKGASGPCPNCGVASGVSGIGEHEMTWPTTQYAVGGKEILHG